MTEELQNYKETNKFTSSEKLSWWGDGEWIEEPDEVTFQYEGFHCIIIRMASREPKRVSGGYLCGYVKVPENHPIYGKDCDEIQGLDGLTEIDEANSSFLPQTGQWIGFNYNQHLDDYCPSMQSYKKANPDFMKMEQVFDDSLKKVLQVEELPEKTYRNIIFCIEGCKYIVRQLKEMVV